MEKFVQLLVSFEFIDVFSRRLFDLINFMEIILGPSGELRITNSYRDRLVDNRTKAKY